MSMRYTVQQLEDLKARGLIKDFEVKQEKKSTTISIEAGKIKVSNKKGQKIKDWILLHLQYWCDSHNLELRHAGHEKGEFMFDPERQWRFDFAVASKKIAWEYEGLMSKKSRHTTISGFTGDTEKYNEAASQGWRVFRYTAKNYKQLITDLNRIL